MDTSWASAAKITPSGPNASLLMCRNSGVTPVVASEFSADRTPGHRQAQAQDDDEQRAETELGHAVSPFRRIILRVSSPARPATARALLRAGTLRVTTTMPAG